MQRDIIYYCWNSIRRLGDASMPLQKGKPTFKVRFEQNIARADYIHHLYDIFADPVGILCWNASTSTGYSWWWRDNLFGFELLVTQS